MIAMKVFEDDITDDDDDDDDSWDRTSPFSPEEVDE